MYYIPTLLIRENGKLAALYFSVSATVITAATCRAQVILFHCAHLSWTYKCSVHNAACSTILAHVDHFNWSCPEIVFIALLALENRSHTSVSYYKLIWQKNIPLPWYTHGLLNSEKAHNEKQVIPICWNNCCSAMRYKPWQPGGPGVALTHKRPMYFQANMLRSISSTKNTWP